MNATTEQRCPKCGKPVECGIAAGKKDCWCFSYAPVPTIDGTECMCPECLSKAAAADSPPNADKPM
ncbi:MAG: cysteine-rich CWC family protein [Bacteroidetes bacterium]|nr:cysteine-rich CWC family protein [Bacteroidota bacterium]